MKNHKHTLTAAGDLDSKKTYRINIYCKNENCKYEIEKRFRVEESNWENEW